MIRLEQLRLDARLSVPALAREVGITPKVIYRLESNGRAGDPETLGRIADYFAVPASELLMPAVPA